ncbi:MAG TPA: DUF3795 domain-containing protein [Candidatus Acidoferrales bacterium]|nr:DUF3795 domain-containing protein [Candidatus Acidoferrales bacterium]
MDPKFTSELIAPCGMNCGLCKSYLAYSRGVPQKKGEVSHCSGCRVRNKNCAFVKRDCPRKVGKNLSSCGECPDIPCERLAKLDEHYRLRYGAGFVENLKMIQEKGMDEFLKSQTEKYRCPSCGDILSIHDGKCYACGYQAPKPKPLDPKYRWKPNKPNKN